ncbi:hypothetical protein GCM10009616_40570 [Microlunatus lacustris]
MRRGVWIDLDSPPSDKQWGGELEYNTGGGAEITSSDKTFYMPSGMFADLDEGTATYETCSSTSGYGYSNVNKELLESLHKMTKKRCVRYSSDSSEMRYARIVLKEELKAGAVFDITVWYDE